MVSTLPQAYRVGHEFRTGGPAPVRAALLAARSRTLALADAYERALAPRGMSVAYSPTVNPPLWELGHIGWFQEYWIGRSRQCDRGIACDPEHPRLPSVLADADRWYDSGRVHHETRWELPLPDGVATRGYLESTLEQTLERLDALPAEASADQLYFYRLVALHEEMHAEAATYMARALAIDLPQSPAAPGRAVNRTDTTLRVPAQSFELGWAAHGFAFDNELGAHRVELAAFDIDARPVSWARFMPFAEQDGYSQSRWWDDQGWAWLQRGPVVAPSPPPGGDAAPVVHLSAWEARAWCRWAGRRLPTEAEWECAACTVPGFDWGQVWEWTASPFQPYPGFTAHPYRDYSQPWFGTRQVLRGACGATASVLRYPRYRNFFEPHRRDIFSGFRSCA